MKYLIVLNGKYLDICGYLGFPRDDPRRATAYKTVDAARAAIAVCRSKAGAKMPGVGVCAADTLEVVWSEAAPEPKPVVAAPAPAHDWIGDDWGDAWLGDD